KIGRHLGQPELDAITRAVEVLESMADDLPPVQPVAVPSSADAPPSSGTEAPGSAATPEGGKQAPQTPGSVDVGPTPAVFLYPVSVMESGPPDPSPALAEPALIERFRSLVEEAYRLAREYHEDAPLSPHLRLEQRFSIAFSLKLLFGHIIEA